MQTWAIAGVDLLVPLAHDAAGQRGVRRRLEEALREAVRTGRLAAGTRLPASRALAGDLGLARNTVADAFTQLVAEGWLEARTGAGTYVAAARTADRTADPGLARAPRDPLGLRRPHPGPAALPGGRTPGTTVPRHDLRPGSPDLSLFPRAVWLGATRRALSAAEHTAFGYGDPRGRPETRAALSAYLARVRGVAADPERLVVCGGHVQAATLLARVLVAHGGRAAAVEAPGLPYLPELVRRAGLRVTGLPVDEHGARTDLLPGLDVAAALLTPAHQFPTGAVLSAARRGAALDWARGTGGLLVEDDYDGEFRFDRRPVGALQGLSAPHVAYVGTASKSLAPGLRLGWLVVPEHLLDAVVEEKRYADSQSPVIEQLALADLLASGAYDRQVRRARLLYDRRRRELVAALAQRAPGATPVGMPAGLQVTVRLPEGADEAAVRDRGRKQGLAIDGLADYGGDAGLGPALVVGYGTPTGRAWHAALDALCRLLAQP